MHRKNGPDNAFFFKQFHIHHDRCAMKVGTDAVLLGAWANVNGTQRILDIGTGTGIIALMLAQRSAKNTLIDAIEIDIDAYQQAFENANDSPWHHRINAIHSSLQNFITPFKYDLIITNPPYFINSQKPPDQKRKQSRHADELPYPVLISACKNLLHREGRLCLILPREEASIFISMAAEANLYCSKKIAVKFKQLKPVERLLLEFSNDFRKPIKDELILFDEEGSRTQAYQRLVSPFYLTY